MKQESESKPSLRGKPGGGKALRALADQIPADTDFHDMVLGLERPGHDVPSRDRYIAIVAAGAIEVALRGAITKHLAVDLSDEERDRIFDMTLGDFARRIGMARALGVISAEQRIELDRIRAIRNAFAHAMLPMTFESPEVADVLQRIWHIPVSSWAGYMFPGFPPHRQFIIICASFAADLARYNLGRTPTKRGGRRKPAGTGSAKG